VADRSTTTRNAIIDAAERLWAQQGLAAVSARQILSAAGQRNNGALRYHFGDVDGLLEAVMSRHVAPIEARAMELATEVGDPSAAKIRDLVGVAFRPSLEYIGAGPSARAWICILAELLARPNQTSRQLATHTNPATVANGTELVRRIEGDLGTRFAITRIRAATTAGHHLMAERARLHDAPRAVLRTLLPLPAFTEVVIDMLTSAVSDPPSAATRAALQK
jgi:AcrR family transcriptional regulator